MSNQTPSPSPSPPTPAVTSSSSTSASVADDLLYGFDIPDDETRSFLSSVIASGQTPRADLDELRELSLMRGVEEWDMLFACAAGLRERAGLLRHDGGGDKARAEEGSLVSWLGAVLGGRQVGGGGSVVRMREEGGKKGRREKAVRRGGGKRGEGVGREVSHFWGGGEETRRKPGASQCRADAVPLSGASAQPWKGSSRYPTREQEGAVDEVVNNVTITPEIEVVTTTPLPAGNQVPDFLDEIQAEAVTTADRSLIPPSLPKEAASSASGPSKGDSPQKTKTPKGSKSPFFADPPSPPSCATPRKQLAGSSTPTTPPPSTQRKPPRPPRGTISSLPIPPLSAPSFGLIQEELAHDPFALLIAITFLIRTTGRAAIPVFRQVIQKWPTPEVLAAADEAEMVALIKPLGLSGVRCAAIRRYARGWLERPPSRGRRYGVKNYPKRGDGAGVGAGEEFGPEDEDGDVGDVGGDGGEVGVVDAVADARARAVGCAWEIGHLTQGPYALDSWRIFCRDVLLGRAEHWTGRGAPEGFQPEWMRVLPRDKELRACLRWMWMREGWEWDPVTGEREPLREEMRRAVDEGRVGYDDTGGLVILPQASSNVG